MSREQRRLAAIVVADVVGYSRLMGLDDGGTLAKLKAHRIDLIDPKIAECGGRTVKSMGDGLLLEFPSVVDAVRCAVDVQRGMADRNGSVPAEQQIRFRIGINLGDIIADGDDIFGDGVNVAARLEALADPGGICISRIVRDQVLDKLSVAFEPMGTRELKNIARPIEVFRIEVAADATAGPAPQAVGRPMGSTPEPPSIAVLPFANRSRSPEDEYFSDGLADELLNALTKVRGLRVAARSSAFTFKGKGATVAEVGRALNVATVLEGSVRKFANRMRISVQLVSVSDGYHLWSESYDRNVDDVFAVQDDIAQSVVKELRTALAGAYLGNFDRDEARDQVRAALAGSRANNPEAHRLYLQARFFADRLTAADVERSIALYEQAIALDPGFALAHAGLSSALWYATSSGLAPSYADGYERARKAAQRALAIAPGLPEAHTCLGQVNATYDWDWKAAAEEFRKAREAAPGNTDVLMASGQLAGTLRHHREAIEFLRQAMALDPLRAPVRLWLAIAYYLDEQFEEAAIAARAALEINPTQGLAYGILSYIHLLKGDASEALKLAAREDMAYLQLTAEAVANHTLGYAAESDAALSRLTSKYDIDAAFQIAQVYAWRGENDRAFDWLERAFKHRDPGLPWWNGDPLLRQLHNDPRWTPLLARMGVA